MEVLCSCCCCFSNPAMTNTTSEDGRKAKPEGLTICNTIDNPEVGIFTHEAKPLSLPATIAVHQNVQNACCCSASSCADKEGKELCKNEVPHSPEIHVVQFDYMARSHEELSVKEGECLEILSKEGDWWLAQKVWKGSNKRKNPCSGFVPVEILAKEKSLEGEPWYCGKMTRFEAENHLLSSSQTIDMFLVRKSETFQNSYVLSAKNGESIIHVVILQKENGHYYVTEDRDFHNIHELIEHYQHNAIQYDTRLNRPSKKADLNVLEIKLITWYTTGISAAFCIKKKPSLRHLSYNTVDKWERPKEEFTLIKCIGSGNYGEVWKAIWNDSVPVAIKMLKEEVKDSSNLLKEAQIMKNFQHENLVPLYAVCTIKQPFFIVTELLKHGDLLNYLRESEGCFTIAQLIEMAIQIATGMLYLESKQCIHRDLAARNVLVGDNIVCKISDFGLTRLLKDATTGSIPDSQLPIKWTAPELASMNQASMKSDVWSFGIVLFEITTNGKIPYPGMTNKMVLSELLQGYRMPRPNGCPQPIYNIMRQCWNEIPSQRPSFSILKLQLEEFIITNYSPLY